MAVFHNEYIITRSRNFVPVTASIAQSGPHKFNQGLAEPGTANRHILTEKNEFPPVQEVMVEDATYASIKGRLGDGQLRWKLSAAS